jgi:carbonic anhydrase
MNRRHALKALAGLALCPLCAPSGIAAEGAHWSYEGAGGPAKWGDLDAASKVCTIGSQQSPIDIGTTIKSQLPALKINWAKGADTTVNNGHTIQLNFAEGSTLTLGDVKYKLLQVHFHRPSEHLIGGKNFPMEAHFVHRADSGALAVVGVLMAKIEPADLADAGRDQQIGAAAGGADDELDGLLIALGQRARGDHCIGSKHRLERSGTGGMKLRAA